jgi:xanthine dehydrogenase accessory factor
MSQTLAAVIELIDALRAKGLDFCVVTVVRTANATSAKAGAKAVVTADGVLHGFVGGGCVQGAVQKVAKEVLASGEPRLIRVRPKDEEDQAPEVEQHDSACPSGGTVELFLEPTRQHPRLVILGSAPVAAALERLAGAMGWETHAGVSPAAAADLGALALRAQDAVVVATQGKGDRPALEAALRSPAGYVAMVGSRKKLGILLERLGDAVTEARKRALHGPAGLDLGAIEPEEIALSILAEIVRHRRRGG